MADDEDYERYDLLFKLLLIGDSGVGKSCLLVRFADDKYSEDSQCTIGVDFKIKMMDFQGQRINLTIWDTAGQEKFRSLTSSYYRGTNGVILVYDVSRRDSFDHLNVWLNELEMYNNYGDPVKLLVGNKVDKEQERQVTREEGQNFAREHQMIFIETSAKTKVGVQQAFEEIVQKILDSKTIEPKAAKPGIDIHGQNPEEGACWC